MRPSRYGFFALSLALSMAGFAEVHAQGAIPPPPPPTGFYVNVSATGATAFWTPTSVENVLFTMDNGQSIGFVGTVGHGFLATPIDLTKPHGFTLVGTTWFGKSQSVSYNYAPPVVVSTAVRSVPFVGINQSSQTLTGGISITTGQGTNASGFLFSLTPLGRTAGTISNVVFYPARQYTATVGIQQYVGTAPVQYQCHTTIAAVNQQLPAGTKLSFTVSFGANDLPTCTIRAQ